jgi:hypothetical protein
MVTSKPQQDAALSAFNEPMNVGPTGQDCQAQSPPPDAGLASDSAMALRSAAGAPAEVAIADLDDLCAAVTTRLAECAVQPTEVQRVVLACVQALQQLHLTASNELARRQQRIDDLQRALRAAQRG